MAFFGWFDVLLAAILLLVLVTGSGLQVILRSSKEQKLEKAKEQKLADLLIAADLLVHELGSVALGDIARMRVEALAITHREYNEMQTGKED